MTAAACHTATLMIGAYVLAGLAPIPAGRMRVLVLALLPTLAASWLIGFAWPGGAVVTMVYVVSMTGFHFQEKTRSATWWLVAQTAVVATMIGLAPSTGRLESLPTAVVAGMALFAGAAITMEWGGAWVARAIRPFAEGLSANDEDDSETMDDRTSRRGLPGGFPDGGRMIGRLERLLVFLFVMVGTPTAIGFLVAAKSILRFGEIRDSESRKVAEYVIIGTLMSFGFALVTSYLTRFTVMALLADSPLDVLLDGGG